MKILVLVPTEEPQQAYFQSCAPEAQFIFSSQQLADAEQVKAAHIIIGNPSAEMLRDSQNLKWLQLESAGVGRYTLPGVLPPGTLLTNASGAYGLAISEYMLGAVIMLQMNLHLYRDSQHLSKWSYLGPVQSIDRSVVLVIGLGDIGASFAKRVKALGAYTIGIRRSDFSKPEYLDELWGMEALQDVLPRADIAALSLPETPLTQKILNGETLALMKKNSVIVNVGRGSAIDTEALCDALENGHIHGAALDVTDPEPLPPDHRLWKLKNAVITPHVSNGYSLKQTQESIVRISGENLKAYLIGHTLNNLVDFEAGY